MRGRGASKRQAGELRRAMPMSVMDWLRTPDFEGMREEVRCKVAAELDDQEYDTTSLIAQMSDQELAQMSDKLQLKPPPRRMLAAAIGKLRQSVTQQHGGAATEQGVEPSALPKLQVLQAGLSHSSTPPAATAAGFEQGSPEWLDAAMDAMTASVLLGLCRSNGQSPLQALPLDLLRNHVVRLTFESRISTAARFNRCSRSTWKRVGGRTSQNTCAC